ncbi:hypothetical protein [Novosphingobium mangrovi (ex Hu et al. 2023)]|uniref:Terminase small subunit n=1 Tax=Novosphingobium mangrovi (ex Hu et al. 2023) TaxID=2930094 RepID=A0ABT0A9R4_9SPHN|nr:hypothetical protein [Novosphingobium mangrovi (ex Hu et al. 2023)]MCJ1959928.1 hypothetical protein [Novosphingobium mangrovi (ex Hu et al. 2023)]
MSFSDALNGAGAKPAGKRPYFLEPQVEKVLAITMAVAQELAVARQRNDTLERLLREKGILEDGEIDAFEPTREASAQRQMWNQEYIARILRIVQQENEAAVLDDDVASGDVGEELAREA